LLALWILRAPDSYSATQRLLVPLFNVLA